ncbi:hypothetical protein DPMN_137969 [Dreissena polymorpha]|uniref:Uncharacterized protein n=1 Tax=Dreissena polymorpha TaxID=45954 RepID=A0A9D4G6R5_DREPO|nr:hypothetical protein DPMN_137969 [Dreissena polymorpha]
MQMVKDHEPFNYACDRDTDLNKVQCSHISFMFVFQTARLIFIVRDLPSLACLGYLCVSIPVCIFHGLRSKSLRIFTSSERVSFLGEDKDLESTSEAEHVRDLLRPPKPPP